MSHPPIFVQQQLMISHLARGTRDNRNEPRIVDDEGDETEETGHSKFEVSNLK
jgi:hypothetical protein